jgi:hypothetical protein
MKPRALAVGPLVLILALALPQLAAAHGHVEVGEYSLVIGFHNEPAYQGEPNGLDLFVTVHDTGEPVNGLEETLRVEILFGASRRELPLEAQWGAEGAYTAYLVPTEAGDYTWRIFGRIEDTPVDVSMTSGPETFSPVEAKSTVAFPAPEPTASELAGGARTATVVAAAALAQGLLALATGVVALRTSRRA